MRNFILNKEFKAILFPNNLNKKTKKKAKQKQKIKVN